MANNLLRQQASVRSLAQTLKSRPDADSAIIFSSRVRAHGFEFYPGRLVHITGQDADIVMPTSAEQQSRLIREDENCAVLFNTTPAYSLVRSRAFKKNYAPLGWIKLDQAGDFILTGNAAIIAQDKITAEVR